MKRNLITVAVALVVAAASVSPAGADQSITITSPAEGASISRSATPQIALAGTVAFVTPAPAERKFYLVGDNYVSSPGQESGPQAFGHCARVGWSTGGTCSDRLILEPKDERRRTPRDIAAIEVLSALCGGVSPLVLKPCVHNWQTLEPGAVPGEDPGAPYTLDTSKPITGVLTLKWDEAGVTLTAGEVEVLFILRGVTGGEQVTLGTASVSKVILPGAASNHEFGFSIQPPAELDKSDFTSLWLQTLVGGTHVSQTWTRGFVVQGGASYMVVPGYSASFGPPSVQVSVDGGAYRSEGITVSPDLTSWSGSLPTPKFNRGYTISARSQQGDVPLAETSVSIVVTD